MFAKRLEKWAIETPDRVALQVKRQGHWQCSTYSQLWSRARSAGANLQQSGVKPGDTVALFAQSCPEWIIAYLGIHLSGAVVVPIDAQYGKQELEILLTFSDCRAIVVDGERLDLARSIHSGLGDSFRVWSLESDLDNSLWKVSGGQSLEPYTHKADDLMSIIFTSGTTGDPKGVPLSCANISANIEGVLDAIRVTPKDNLLNLLPLHHAYASTAAAFSPLAAGGTVTFCPSLKAPDILAAMQETGVTILPGVPQLFTQFERGIFQKISSAGLLARSAFHLFYRISSSIRTSFGLRVGKIFFHKVHKQFGKRLRFFVSGGAKLDPQVADRLSNLGFLVLEGYGLTETAPVISFTPISRPTAGSVGLPLKGVEIRIDNPDEKGQGEICMRGPNLMRGYYKKERETQEVIREGWFHTGDLGFLDQGGMLTITGRAKEIIVLPSGKNIYPEEVEVHYQNAPFVKEICILQHNKPDGSPGGLRAAVVPDTEALAARKVPSTRERLRFELTRVASNLPSYMRLNDLVLLDGPLPRTRLGKLRRSKVAELATARQSAGRSSDRPAWSVEMKALMEHPAAIPFLTRLQEVTGQSERPTPDQDLEMDLGVDSLTQVQIAAVLEQELGVEIPDDAFLQLRTVGDLLKHVTQSEPATMAQRTEVSWSQRLAELPEVPLDRLFNLQRGGFRQFLVECVRLVLALLLRILFRARIDGLEKIPRQGAFLICPNHQSYLDALVIYGLFPARQVRRLLFIAFGEIFARPPLSWVSGVGRIIQTGGADTLAESLRLSADGLRRGFSVCLFPEGSRSNDGEIAKPRLGAGILACENRVSIVPVLIDGADKTLSPRHPGFRPCRIRLRVGDPIAPPPGDHFTQPDYQQVMDRWHEAMVQLRSNMIRKPPVNAPEEQS